MKGAGDLLRLEGIKLQCCIGVTPAERRRPRQLTCVVELACNLDRAGISDCLEDTVDYAALLKQIRTGVEQRSWQLLEAVARHIAGICLLDRKIRSVRVMLTKSRVLPGLAGATVEIFRSARRGR
ncbi:MAG: dihydroneopterin aldolase [Kiritimatiellia bacterium]|nr:dihydroneopterin aldolase [Lentisphaerota bacterium]